MSGRVLALLSDRVHTGKTRDIYMRFELTSESVKEAAVGNRPELAKPTPIKYKGKHLSQGWSGKEKVPW